MVEPQNKNPVELKLSLSDLVCPISGRQLEFVCTKKDSKLCVDRLCCSKCIITDYPDHFQWMKLIEDFFVPNSQANPSDSKIAHFSEMEAYLEKREEHTKEFDQRVDKDADALREKLTALRQRIAEEFKKIEDSVQGQRDSFFQNFSNNYSEIEKALNPSSSSDGEIVISEMDQFNEFLEEKVKSENEKQDLKPAKVIESLHDALNSISIVHLNDKKAAQMVEATKKLTSFGIVIDRFNYFRKKNTNYTIKTSLQNLSSKFVMNTGSKKVLKMTLINDDTQIAICSDDETITIWDRTTSGLVQTLTGHNERTLTVIQLRDGSLASGGFDNKVKIWNIAKGTCEQELTGHTGHVSCLIELPQMSLLSGSKDKSLRLWELKNKDKPSKSTLLDPKQNRVFAMTLLSHELLAVSSESNINIVNLDEFTIKKSLMGHTGIVRDLVVVEKEPSNLLLSASEDKSIKLWDVGASTLIRTFTGHKGIINKLLVLNAKYFVSGAEDSELKFWDIDEGKNEHSISAHSPGVTDLALIKDHIVSCGTDKTIKLWSE